MQPAHHSPLVSVIVPIYNVEKYIRKCVFSIINQTYQKLEIILINDGSTDSSSQICKEFIIDHRVIFIEQPNQGLSGARNSGIDAASGEFVVFVDSDDWIDHATIKMAIESQKTNHAELVFWSRSNEFSNRSKRENTIFDANRLFTDADIKWLHRRMFGLVGDEMNSPTRTDAINSAWGKLFKTSIIKDNNIQFIDTKIVGSEDVPFILEYMCHTSTAFYLHDYLSHYRKDNDNSLTKNHGSTLFPRFLNLFNTLKNLISKHKLSPEFEAALNNRICLSLINLTQAIESSRNSETTKERIIGIDKIINNHQYSLAIQSFDILQTPIIWRPFFLFARKKYAFGVYCLTWVMRKLRNK